MRTIFCFVLFSSSIITSAQSRTVGTYADYFGRKLELNADSTFDYSYHFDLYSTWTQGVWSLRNDTVYFKWLPVYDTIRITNPPGQFKDSLILSLDRKAEGVGPPDEKVLYSGGQNYYPYPQKLFYHRDKLYTISKEGKLVKKKIRGIWRKTKSPPWYRKVEKSD